MRRKIDIGDILGDKLLEPRVAYMDNVGQGAFSLALLSAEKSMSFSQPIRYNLISIACLTSYAFDRANVHGRHLLDW